MICKEDCVAFAGLTPDEVEAIAEHEHVGTIAAAALAHYLLHSENGAVRIRQMIVDDVRLALAAGQDEHAAELVTALRHFLHEHPEARLPKA